MTKPIAKPNGASRQQPPRADDRVLLTPKGWQHTGAGERYALAKTAHLRALFTNQQRR